jgi:hypothetical protein
MLERINCLWEKLKNKEKTLTGWDSYQTTMYKFLIK